MAEFRTANGLVSCTPFMRTAAGLVEIKAPMMRTAAGLIPVGKPATALSATVSAEYVYGAVSRNESAYVATNSTRADAVGGTPPYTYQWAGEPTMNINNPSSATTAFSAFVGPFDGASGAYTCTITDARGATATSPIVNASVYNEGGPGGVIP